MTERIVPLLRDQMLRELWPTHSTKPFDAWIADKIYGQAVDHIITLWTEPSDAIWHEERT